jgi:hypothetical protein
MHCRGRLRFALAAGLCTAGTTGASAHVKWFSPFDISQAPVSLDSVLNPDLWLLLLFALALLLLGCIVETTAIGRVLLRGMNVLSRPLEASSDVVIRAACGFFLVSIWALGGIILTPELKTNQAWISWLQLAIAACLVWRPTLILAAAGLIALYGIALHAYGVFHLLDYPIFIALAIYLALSATTGSLFGIRALDILRWGVAITLMWASVEKWAYPQWSFPLIDANPKITLCFSRGYYMQAAGVVEFALSFAMVMGPLVRRTAAAILLGMFGSAVIPFGKIDAIGHAPIMAAVLAVLVDSSPGGGLFDFRTTSAGALGRGIVQLSLSYGSLLAAFIAAYYVLHAEFYGDAGGYLTSTVMRILG